MVGAGAGFQVAGDATGQNRLTARQIEELQKQAYEEAFQQGLQAGQQIINEKVAMLDSIFRALANPLDELDGTVESEIVELVIAMMRQLVRRELKLDPGQVVAVVKDALRALPLSARNIQIRLNPEDMKIVSGALGAPLEQQNWQLIDDPVISRGGCQVVTSTSQIDSTVEAQIARLIAEVFGDQRTREEQSE